MNDAPDKNWVMDVLRHLSTIGRTDAGGSNRLAFSPADMEARACFKGLITEAGLTLREDAFGNIIARLEGRDPSLPALGTGSHIDTVPNGGHYDGMMGSVASLAAIKRLKARGTLRRPLELIIFQMEESSRFSLSTLGSKMMSGAANLELCKTAKDKQGVTMPEALAACGYDFDKLPSAARKKGELECFIEMHIDQSPTLEEKNLAVGIVTAIAAPIRTHVVVEGRASHSGGTAMASRKDALVSAAELVLAVRAVGNSFASREIVATVGNLTVQPGAMNVVPGAVELWIDLRGTSKAVMDQAQEALVKAAAAIGATYGTPITFNSLGSEFPVSMSPAIIGTMEDAARSLDIPSARVVSGAGHDTMNIAAITNSAGMIFVRAKEGLSHNPGEHVEPDDIMTGLDLLTETLYRLAQ